MESQKLFAYGLTGTGLSYSASHPPFPSIPSRLFPPFKFDFGSSPNSPFLTHHESEAFSTLSSSQEQHSSSDNNFSAFSPSSDHSLETSSSNLHRPSGLPVGSYRQNLPCRTSLSRDGNYSQNMKYALLELETALMNTDEDDEVTAPNASIRTRNIPLQQSTQPQGCISHRRPAEDMRVEKRHKVIKESPIQDFKPSDLKQLLIACAKALEDEDFNGFENVVEKAREAVS
ncbi:hypothetical protein CRG98_050076, partial [Punica granatum]